MKRTVGRVLLGLVVVAILLVLAGAWRVHRSLHRPHAGWSGDHVDVVLEPGLGAGEMLHRLSGSGVLERAAPARLWLRLCGCGGELRAGEYRFDEPLSPVQVIERLIEGQVLLHAVTIPEGLSAVETAQRFVAAGFGDVESFRAVIADPAPIRELDPAAPNLEGYLFPDTYHFPRSASPRTIVETMVARFRTVVGDGYAERAAAAGLSLHEAVTLASIVEKETSLPEERGRIAMVFHNRLERKMRLQSDPTVRYAIERSGGSVGRLTYADLEFDSPWNTYAVRGLPPGPIANPGVECLFAAVEPEEGELLYFVAAPEGGHRFSKDLDSHNRAVAEWRRHSRSSR